MSIGINLINNILKDISAMLYENYDIEIVEKHHNQKIDAPSGTALFLANTIKNAIPKETVFNQGRNGIAKREHNEIGIHAVRGGSIVGDHEIIFAGAGEIIELKHTALSREVFAIGALKACEYMSGKGTGMYSMDSVIKGN
jgi:4-hydroxy-tetrahydrodipicolinate reductase